MIGDLERGNVEPIGEGDPERGGQVGHHGKIVARFSIDPICDLSASEARFSHLDQKILQFGPG